MTDFKALDAWGLWQLAIIYSVTAQVNAVW